MSKCSRLRLSTAPRTEGRQQRNAHTCQPISACFSIYQPLFDISRDVLSGNSPNGGVGEPLQ